MISERFLHKDGLNEHSSTNVEKLTIYTSLTGEQIAQVKEMKDVMDRSYASLIRLALAHYYRAGYPEPPR